MDQLLKGMAFQDQSAAINERTDRGKVAARGTAGASMLAAQQSVSAAIGRQAAARDEQLVGSVLANELREDARIRSLNAAREKQFNSVRYAPERSRQMDRPELLSGPSPYSLISGIGQAALSGVTAGLGQQNFLDQSLQVKTPHRYKSLNKLWNKYNFNSNNSRDCSRTRCR